MVIGGGFVVFDEYVEVFDEDKFVKEVVKVKKLVLKKKK